MYTSSSKSGSNHNLESINSVEYLRGIAALSVAWLHLTNTFASSWVRQSGAWAGLGVECFFVISGFIIPYSLSRSGYKLRDFPNFMLRRIVRLEPPYVMSILLVLLLWELSARIPGHMAQPSYELPQLAAHLFYLIPLTGYDWLNIVYWSLAYEFVFYLAAGLSWPFLARRSIWLTVAIYLAAFFLVKLPLIFLFLIGTAGVRYFLKADGLASSLGAVLVATAMLYYYLGLAVAVVGILSISILVFSSMPQLYILGCLGELSYSLYLIHVPAGGRVITLGKQFAGTPFSDFLLSIIALAICIGFSFLYMKFIEAPAKRAAKHIKLSKRNCAALPAAYARPVSAFLPSQPSRTGA
jgi:peptidoglycan/LPS O-acetylase OafA/YrhL